MSEQPPSAAPTATTAARALVLAGDDIAASLRKIEYDGFGKVEHVPAERPLCTDGGAHLGTRNLRLAGEEEIFIVAGQRVVERRLDRIARPRRPHETRRDDDGEIGFVLDVGPARE